MDGYPSFSLGLGLDFCSPLPGDTMAAETREVMFGAWEEYARDRGVDLNHEADPETCHLALKAVIASKLAGFTPPPVPKTLLSNPGRKWRAMSAMQKAVRRGNLEMALKPTYALLAAGQGANFWRRLAVTATEDVGLGNPWAAAAVSLLARSKSARTQFGYSEEHIAAWCCNALCRGLKNRDLCELVVYAGLSTHPLQEFDDLLEGRGGGALYTIAKAPGNALGVRWAATIRLGGHRSWQPFGRPLKPAHSEWHHRLLEGLPGALQLLSQQNIAATGEPLSLAIPLSWELLGGQPTVGVDRLDFGDSAKIGSVYAATFDKHVAEGKRAITWLCNSHLPVRSFMEKRGLNGPEVMSAAAFYCEGAVVRPHLTAPGSSGLHATFVRERFRSVGLNSDEEIGALFALFEDNLPRLNQIRQMMAA